MKLARLFVILLVVSVIIMSAAGSAAANVSGLGEGRDHPLGWHHRPVMEFFTALCCPPCMETGEPATTSAWLDTGYSGGWPFTFVVYHMTNGGDGNDPLNIPEAKERYDEFNVVGTPDNFIDAGYRNTASDGASIKQALEDAGTREDTYFQDQFKKTEIEVYQVFTGDGFDLKVKVTYLGEDYQTVRQMMNGQLNGRLDIMMVEENVTAWSSELNEYVNCHNVFRGFGVHGESVSLGMGESFEQTYSWKIPDLPEENEFGSIVPQVNPANVSAVAAIYDLDDTTSGGSGSRPGNPRAINSATPQSTAWDKKNDPPEVSAPEFRWKDGKTTVTVQVNDTEGVLGGYIVYNTVAPNHTGNWSIAEMTISEDGTTATAEISLAEGQTAYYRIIMYDQNWTGSTSALETYVAVEGPGGPGASGGNGAVIGVVFLLVLTVIAAFILKQKGMIGKKPEPVPQEAVVLEEPSEAEPETEEAEPTDGEDQPAE